MGVAVSARRAGDRHLEVYYVESADDGASWSQPMRMLHAADGRARTSVNVVHDAGSVWVAALRTPANSSTKRSNNEDDDEGATDAAVWYRERGDRFTVETQVAGAARERGLALAVTTVGDRRLMFLSSSAERAAGAATGDFDVVYRQEVERPFGNTWLWPKEPACRDTHPVVIAKGFAMDTRTRMTTLKLQHWPLTHSPRFQQKLLCDVVYRQG